MDRHTFLPTPFSGTPTNSTLLYNCAHELSYADTSSMRDADTLERAANQCSSAIITAYKHNCVSSEIKKARETHWWNRKLEELRKETRGRFKQVKKGNTKELWNLSNATRDVYRKAIRHAKSKSWTSFCSDIEKGAETARLNRLLTRNPETMPVIGISRRSVTEDLVLLVSGQERDPGPYPLARAVESCLRSSDGYATGIP